MEGGNCGLSGRWNGSCTEWKKHILPDTELQQICQRDLCGRTI